MLDWKPISSSILSLALIALALLGVSALAVDALAEYGPGSAYRTLAARPHSAVAYPQHELEGATDRGAIIISAICITEAAIRTCYAQ